MAKPRFKTPPLQKMYESCRKLGADPSSEFYHEGRQRRGAGHRCAFWDGFNGTRSIYGRDGYDGTFGYAAFAAGQDNAKAAASRRARLLDAAPRMLDVLRAFVAGIDPAVLVERDLPMSSLAEQRRDAELLIEEIEGGA